MKIAVFGDIHGNIDALKAAYKAAVDSGVDKIYHLGDLGGYAPFVNEVVDFMIEHDIEGVQGNYDDAVANELEHCGCKYESALQSEMADLSFKWTKDHTSARSKEYMKNLPFTLLLSVDGRKIVLFHATPLKNNLYWHEERPEKFFLEMSEKLEADVLVYGHTHKPYRRDIGPKVFINAGSVGKPKDGDSRACLALIRVTADEVKTEFRRLAYDVEKVAAALVSSGLPRYFAERLRAGG